MPESPGKREANTRCFRRTQASSTTTYCSTRAPNPKPALFLTTEKLSASSPSQWKCLLRSGRRGRRGHEEDEDDENSPIRAAGEVLSLSMIVLRGRGGLWRTLPRQRFASASIVPVLAAPQFNSPSMTRGSFGLSALAIIRSASSCCSCSSFSKSRLYAATAPRWAIACGGRPCARSRMAFAAPTRAAGGASSSLMILARAAIAAGLCDRASAITSRSSRGLPPGLPDTPF
jgi:hypothetical protein